MKENSLKFVESSDQQLAEIQADITKINAEIGKLDKAFKAETAQALNLNLKTGAQEQVLINLEAQQKAMLAKIKELTEKRDLFISILEKIDYTVRVKHFWQKLDEHLHQTESKPNAETTQEAKKEQAEALKTEYNELKEYNNPPPEAHEFLVRFEKLVTKL